MGKREKDNSVLRLIEFIEYLREHPQEHKISALAEHFNVKRNQIYRWMKYAFDRYGIPIDQAPFTSRGSIKLGEGNHEVKRTQLDRFEVEALLAAASRIEALTPFAKEALLKLEDSGRISDDHLDIPILYTPLVDEYPEEFFERVVSAIRNYRVAALSYRNAKGQQKTYKFNSYALIVSEQHIHLVGVSHNSLKAGYDTIIRLRLDQIDKFILQRETFKKPKFDVKAYASKEFGPFSGEGESQSIKVQFSKEKAKYIERTKRHHNQKVSIQDDGTALWQITAPLSQDLVFWITSYGPHAKVIEPLELKEQVKAWAKGSLDANS